MPSGNQSIKDDSRLRTVSVRFFPSNTRVRTPIRISIFSLARNNGVAIEGVCGGQGKCGKCKVLIQKTAAVSPITTVEKKLLSESEIKEGIRLACLTKSLADVNINSAIEQRGSKHKILSKGISSQLEIDPFVKRTMVKIPQASLENPLTLHERLRNSLKEFSSIQIPLALYNELANSNFENNPISLTLTSDGRLLKINSDSNSPSYGIAIDIGTTTIVAYLVDLTSGDTIQVASGLNPQFSYGGDVMSRITAAIQTPKNQKHLTQILHKFLLELIEEMRQKTDIKQNMIDEIVVVGNTSMHHFFLGLNQKSLGLSPYTPLVKDLLTLPSERHPLNYEKGTMITTLPVIAGFVGADAVGVMVSTRLDEAEKPTIALDIGTNGEIMLGSKKGLVACSTAAGPAFEGAQIHAGMRGTTGAIERVEISPDLESIEYAVIGNKQPIGICGSGIIDIVAELLKREVIGANGAFNKDLENSRLRYNKDRKQREIVLVRKVDSGTSNDIVFTQKDIREVQLAKGAMFAGQQILLQKQGLALKDLDKVLLAGAFGNYIRTASAKQIGLLPDLPDKQIINIGNAAGSGAKAVLVSQEERQHALKISKSCKYVELTIAPDFQKLFLEANYLPHRNKDLFSYVPRKIN